MAALSIEPGCPLEIGSAVAARITAVGGLPLTYQVSAAARLPDPLIVAGDDAGAAKPDAPRPNGASGDAGTRPATDRAPARV